MIRSGPCSARLVPIVLAGLLSLPAPAGGEPQDDGRIRNDAGFETKVAPDGVVALRDRVVVSEAVVRLGDLFETASAAADTPVAYAPQPGRRAVFDARWLWRVARAYDLAWQPLTRHDRVVVERDSIVLGREELEALILNALAEKDVDVDNARLRLAQTGTEIALLNDPAADLIVDDVLYDHRQHRFVASLIATGPGVADRRFRLTGRLEPMSEVPVPARRIAAGAVIGAGDLTWTALPSGRIKRNTVMDQGRLIGMQARRTLPPGGTIRAGDVGEPVVIAKGEPVTIVLSAPQMLLTARGRALEDGGRGSVIRVVNDQSRAVIEAVVTGPGRVEVDLDPGLARQP